MESNTLHRGRLIDHILLVVEDFEASKNFYTAVLSALEIPVITTANEYLLADELVLASRHSPEAAGKLTGRHHLAFGPEIVTWWTLLPCGADPWRT